MVYRKDFIVVLKHNGRILREIDDTITLPFGSEYSIILKNLSTRKAAAKITVDGQDVLNGYEVIVDADSSTEIKGFMSDTTIKNKFKFIEKTEEISNFRGDKIDDGIVRVTYRFEEPPKPQLLDHINAYWAVDSKRPLRSTYGASDLICKCCTSEFSNNGITVKGSETSQDFNVVYKYNFESNYNVIVLKIQGRRPNTGKAVNKPILTKTKKQCPTCGRHWRSSNKYCGNCGTYL